MKCLSRLPAHREGAYRHLMNENDEKLFDAVRAFNPYDLYSKSDDKPSLKELKPFYEDLVSEFFPDKIAW